MAVTSHFYGPFFQSLANKEVNLNSDALKAILLGTGYTPNMDTHRYKSDLGANEVAGTNYAAGGVALSGIAVTYDTVNHQLKFAVANVVYTNVTLTGANSPRYCALYDNTPATDATRPLIGYVDFGAAQAPSGINLQVTWDPTGTGLVTVT
jgi:hypothetical protein